MQFILTEEELKHLRSRQAAEIIYDCVNAFSPAFLLPSEQAVIVVAEKRKELFDKYKVDAAILLEFFDTPNTPEPLRLPEDLKSLLKCQAASNK